MLITDIIPHWLPIKEILIEVTAVLSIVIITNWIDNTKLINTLNISSHNTSTTSDFTLKKRKKNDYNYYWLMKIIVMCIRYVTQE